MEGVEGYVRVDPNLGYILTLRHRFHPKSSRFFCGGGAQDLDHPVCYGESGKSANAG